MAQSEFDIQLKKKILETFKFTIDFLDSHNLKWWAAYGTCLGAIRHKGMIPCDDDVDIYMPREDYNRFIRISDELRPNGYRLVTLRDKGNYIAYGKVINANTTYVEWEVLPVVSGIWVDIFPLDSCEKDDSIFRTKLETFKSCLEKYHSSLYNYNLPLFLKILKDRQLWLIHPGIKSLRYHSTKAKREAYKQVCTAAEDLENFNGEYYCDASSYCIEGERDIFPKEWANDLIDVPFENFTVKVPARYDEYLSQIYGDYMTPPPVDKQVTNHLNYYTNLNECLSIEDVKTRVKLGYKRESQEII